MLSGLEEVPEEARIDWSVARAAAVNDEELLREMVEAFLSIWEEVADRLTLCLQQGDIAGATRAAHSLKSNMRTFGVRITQTMQQIEYASKAGLTEPMIPVWRETRPAIESVARQMRQWLG